MSGRPTAVLAMLAATAVAFSAACAAEPGGDIVLSLASARSVIVSGLSSRETRALRDARLSDDQMQRVLRVRVAGADTPIAGSYAVADGRIEFTPAFPFDPGRPYTIELVRAELPVRRASGTVSATVALPAPDLSPVTVVTGVHPTAALWPANLLRAYIHFSGPMGRQSGVDFIRLKDADGVEIADAFLPLESDFWNGDHTRYTVFFDPGRVKRGILPNREKGRALEEGQRYTIEVDAKWSDAAGRPLVSTFRHAFRAGPAVEKPLTVADWRIEAPKAGGRNPLVVTFAWPIDHGLSQRALALVGPTGHAVAGKSDLASGDLRWFFTPSEAWVPGEYRLTALPILEDPAGNQIGRAFEVDMTRAPAAPDVPRSRAFRVPAR